MLHLRVLRNCTISLRRCLTSEEKRQWFETHITPKVTFLKQHSILPSDLRKVLAVYPLFALLSVEEHLEPIVNFLRCSQTKDTGLSPSLTTGQLRAIITTQPSIFEASLDYEIQPKCQFFIRDMKLDRQEIAKLITKAPSLLLASSETLKERVYFFHNRFAEMHQIASILERFPEVLEVSMNSLNNLHSYWRENVLRDKDFILMIDRHPALLQLSFDEVLKPMIQYLIFMCRHQRGARILITDPTLFEVPLNELAPRVEYLMRLGLKSREFVATVVDSPRILRMDLENEIKPRIESLIQSGRLTRTRIAEMLHAQPSLLTTEPQTTEEFKLEHVGITSCPIL